MFEIRRATSRLLTGLAAGLGLMLASVAAGQASMPLNANIYRSSITEQDLDWIEEAFNTTQEQMDVITALYQGYQQAFDAGVSETRLKVSELTDQIRQSESTDAWRTIGPKKAQVEDRWARQRLEYEEGFFEDVQSLLTEDQLDHWTSFERDRRRRLTLAINTRLSSEGVDLIELLDEMELSENEAEVIAATRERYAVELDIALMARNEAVNRINRRLKEMADQNHFDDSEAQDLDTSARERRKALQGINVRYAEIISGQLPRDAGEAFKQAFLEKSYPRIYRPTQVDRYSEVVKGLDDLSDDQTTRLDNVLNEFHQSMMPINEQLVEVQKKREEQQQVNYVRQTPGTSNSDLTAQRRALRATEQGLWAQRRKNEQQVLDKIFALLSPEQQLIAPKGRTRPRSDPRTQQREKGQGDADDGV